MRLKVAAIVGATAVGKTQASLEVAERLDAEIISIDSMQLYRGMDIGTDKIPLDERRGIPHHLIDVFDPATEVTVAEFQTLARAAIADVGERGRLPLLIGGSGLYFRAVVDELRFPPRSSEVRTALELEAEEAGAETLHARLAELDPKAAAKIAPSNARRTIRALEVIKLTGRQFSENDGWDSYESIYDLAAARLTRERADLYARIEQRVAEMVDRGLIDEARALAGRGLGRTARQALGYRQVLESAGDEDADEIRDAIAAATKRFARRQDSWFRADPRIHSFAADDPKLTERLIDYFSSTLALPLGA